MRYKLSINIHTQMRIYILELFKRFFLSSNTTKTHYIYLNIIRKLWKLQNYSECKKESNFLFSLFEKLPNSFFLN